MGRNRLARSSRWGWMKNLLTTSLILLLVFGGCQGVPENRADGPVHDPPPGPEGPPRFETGGSDPGRTAVVQVSGSASEPGRTDMPRAPESVSEAGPYRLSLEEAVAMALAQSRALMVTREELEKAEGRTMEAYSLALPVLKGTAGYTRLDDVPHIDFGGDGVRMGRRDNYSAELSLIQYLFRGGKAFSARKGAKLFSRYTREGLRNAEDLVIFQAAKAYCDALLAAQNVEVSRESVGLAEAHARDVENLFRQGLAIDFDRLRASVHLTNMRTSLIQVKNALRLAMAGLRRVLGLPQEAEVALTDRLAYEPVGTGRSEALETAYECRADLMQARLLIELQEANIASIRADLFPQFYLFGAYGWERPSRKTITEDRWDDYWQAGIAMEWLIFDGLAVRGKLRQEAAALRQYKIAERDLREEIHLQVERALLSLEDARELVESQMENVKQAKRGLDLAKAGYRNGVNTALEVRDAENALTLAKLNYSRAIYGHMVARLGLKKATGTLRDAGSKR
jgi:outer membrane protein TolC